MLQTVVEISSLSSLDDWVHGFMNSSNIWSIKERLFKIETYWDPDVPDLTNIVYSVQCCIEMARDAVQVEAEYEMNTCFAGFADLAWFYYPK